ncbi:MAG: divalent-cation tolerance protein CutA [Candidatus Woesearchaeota archaeon]|jgi:periplasmic divalent cation tolerance protein|nr:divalent-cation tolerance protein CutA [Candidatus Woesearchaeota archaeon]
MVLLYITCKDKAEARKVSKLLLEKRLIACSNIHAIDSMYWWKGKLVDDKEYVVIGKTKKKNVKTIRVEVKKIHSYDVPCIMDIDVDANSDYLDWVRKEVK